MTLFKPRNLLLLLALLLAAAIAAIMVRRYRPAVEVAALVKALPANVDVALEDIRYTHNEGGVARWQLVAKQVERQIEGQTTVGDLQLTFFDPRGVEEGILSARNGTISNDFTELEVRQQVEVTSRRGYTLRTERITYRQADRTLRTDAPVQLSADGLSLDGVGLTLDMGTRKLKILGKVRAVIDPSRRIRE